MSDKPLFLQCTCHSDEHTLRWDIEDDELYASVFLHQYRNIFSRIWVAIKYVFGYKCKYGHWDCFTLRPSDVAKMMLLLEEYDKIVGVG